jgi:hypothetical protein
VPSGADRAGLPERHRDRLGWQRVQPGPFDLEQLAGWAAGDPVRPGVDQLAEPLAGRLEFGEGGVVVAEVDLGGDQVPLGDAHGRLRAALGLRVGRHAGADRQPVVPPRRHGVGVADRHPGDVLDGDGLLVIRMRVGRHPPSRRGVASRQPSTLGRVRSQAGRTTRYRDQASHAHHSHTCRRSTRGPVPQSSCSHKPGSGTQGRNTRRCPARKLRLTAATARRVVRSEPAYPIAVSLAWATSAPTRPPERSTHSSSFGSHASTSRSRRGRSSGLRPSSRSRT